MTDILIVEDSKTQEVILRNILEKNGFRVTAASDGRQAIEILQNLKPQMVISDIVMPDLNGFELSRYIKSSDHLRDIPVVLLTSLSDSQDIIQALSAGADYFLTKPYDETRLIQRIRSFLFTCSRRNISDSDDRVDVFWEGETHHIAAGRQQIIDLLFSTYENATYKNRELEQANQELVLLKLKLEQDIANRKKAENGLLESEQRLKLVLDSIQTGVMVVDPDNGQISDINQYAVDRIGLPKSDIVGQPSQTFLCTETPGKPSENLSKTYPEPDQFLIIRGGETVPIMKKVVPVTIHRKTYSLETFVDITEQVNAREEITRAKIEAENASMSKSEFLANTSHELRTPMNGIIGMATLLMDTPLTAEQEEYTETIRNSAESLLTIINDILDFSKIEAGKMDLEVIDFDLRVMVEEVIDLLLAKAIEKGLRLRAMVHHDVPSRLMGDPGRLRQILMNLAGNAIKFTSHGHVLVDVTLENETDASVSLRFSIIDTGIGIPDDKMDRLFQSFSQVDASTTRKYGGTGLGLAISKRITEMMNGQIGVDSTDGKGSTFWFTIPLEKQLETIAPAGTTPVALEEKYILIVDDHAVNRKILKEQLNSWKCVVDVAVSGLEALKKLHDYKQKGTPFHAAIVDMLMPGMDGKMLGRRIKSDPELTETILVMLTSAGKRGDAILLQDIGFSAYLTKPVKQQQLYDCLSTVLGMPLTIVKKPAKPIITRFSLSEEKKRSIRILLVEDNAVNQKVALKMLGKYGYYADTAHNGIDAVRLMENVFYDLVLMDVIMPDMDGYETTARIRDLSSNIRNHDVIVIAMTAHAMKGDREKCLAAGMNDYLSKPINPRSLLETIERWLMKKRNLDQESNLNAL
ncbi:MAG: response regulator [Desulfatirhabdiaceae bacterium]